MFDRAVGEVPVHLVVHYVEFLFVWTAAGVLFEDEVADGFQFGGAEGGTGGILRRAEGQQGGAGKMRFQFGRGGHEIIFGLGFEYDVFGTYEVRIVVVVPGRNGVDDFIARIAEGPENGIDQGAATGGDEDLGDVVLEALVMLDEGLQGLAQFEVPFGHRVIGVLVAVGLFDVLFEFDGNREDGGVEITHGEIIDPGALADAFFDLSAQFDDLGANQSLSQLGEFGRFHGAKILFLKDQLTKDQ